LTAYCGGGPSGPLPGAPQFVTQTAVGVESALILGGFPEIAAILAPLLVAAPFELDTFCAADPPADPGLTLQDAFDAIQLSNPSVSLPALAKAQQWWARQMWFKYCHCTTVATPPPPAISNPGAGLGSNPGLPSGSTTSPCWDTVATLQVPRWNQSGNVPYYDVTQQLIPANPPTLSVTVGTFAGPALVAQSISPGSNNYTLTFSSTPPLGGGQEIQVVVNWFDASGASVGGLTVGGSAGQNSGSATRVATPTNAAYWAAYASQIDSTDKLVNAELKFFCAGQGPNGLQVPCCPPDPLVNNQLTNILNVVLHLLENTSGGGTAPPISWHDGNVHTGLADSGSITLAAGVIGIRVQMTTLPTGVQVSPGNPTFYWDAGFITPIALTSPLRGQRLVFATESMQLPEFTDSIGYTLLHGTVVTITELLATPGP
jgi:hypothetical protein